MDKIIDIKNLYLCLKDIIENRDDIEAVREIIVEFHFYIQKVKLNKEEIHRIDISTLKSISMYLLSVLTNVTSHEMKEYIKNFYTDGLHLAGLIFELLSDMEIEDPYTKHIYYYYCSICYSLAGKEAASAVVSHNMLKNMHKYKMFSSQQERNRCWEFICLTLSRNFKDQYQFRGILKKPLSQPNQNNIWDYISFTLIENACCLVDGEDNTKVFDHINRAKEFFLHQDDIEYLFYISLLNEVLIKMHDKSVWAVLSELGFSNEYIKVLTKYDDKNVYELWKSQLDVLSLNNYGRNYLSSEINRVLITMPTSAGKSFIAELAIIKSLENNKEKLCIFVTPTRALMTEVESNLFYRLRKLNYKVSAVYDTDENDYENALLENTHVLVVTPEKLDLIMRRKKEIIDKIGLIVFDEFHKISDNSRGWLLETLIAFFLISQQRFNNLKLILMSAIVSNGDAINSWLGNDDFKPASSQWSPNRRVYGVIAPHETKFKNINKTTRQLITPYRLVFKYQEKRKAISDIFTDIIEQHKTRRGWNNYPKKSDTKYDRCYKFINTLNDGKVLIYFFTKIDLERFIEYSAKYKNLKQDENLNRLKLFLEKRLGKEHPLVKNIAYGVAYHHGDLPLEVRKEIENSYKSELIDILACTTTLSDGVNLPIKNFVLGSFTSYGSEHKLRIGDFKNIVGRAGRAYIDTEGRIFLILHPEYKLDDEKRKYFNRLVFCEQEETDVLSSMNDMFDDIYLTLNKLESVVEEALADTERSLLDFIDRLQVFIFGLYGEYEESREYNDFICLLNNLLFTFQSSEDTNRKFNEICNKYYSLATSMDENILKRFNKTGLSFRSNRVLEEIVDEISIREDFLNSSLESIIDEGVFENILALKEFKPKTYYYKSGRANTEYSIDHYNAFLKWIGGKSFIEIRDSIFLQDPDISNRTQTCVNYINDMFLYKLPWAFSSLYVLAKDYVTLADIILKDLPAKVKYGVENINAVKLCTLGIESRELANMLASLYEVDSTKEPDDTVDKWIVDKSFYYFQRSIQGIDEVSIRQIARVRTKMRVRTSYLRDEGKITCSVAGLSFYSYQSLMNKKDIKVDSKLRLIHEPENLYDEFAIRVESEGGDQIGYLPAIYSEEVYEYIQGRHEFQVGITELTRKRLNINILALD